MIFRDLVLQEMDTASAFGDSAAFSTNSSDWYAPNDARRVMSEFPLATRIPRKTKRKRKKKHVRTR